MDFKKGGLIEPKRKQFLSVKNSYLIFTNGEETEKKYFKKFKKPITIEKFEVKTKGGKDPLTLVKKANKQIEYEGLKEKYDEIWVVFDIDDYELESIDEAIGLAKSNDIHVAYSNQCIELWFLIHLIDKSPENPIPRESLFDEIDKIFKSKFDDNYKKTKYINDYLRPYIDKAIERAKELEKYFMDKKFKSVNDMNPSTSIYKLIEKLRSN